MPQGLPAFAAAGDLLQVGQGGAFEPAGLTLRGGYTFTAAQTIDLGTGALPSTAQFANRGLALTAADNVNASMAGMAFGTGIGLSFAGFQIGGTRSAPTPTTSGRPIVRQIGAGYDGTTYGVQGGLFDMVSDGLWSGANRGLYFVWAACPNGSTALAEWMRLQNGALTLGLGSPTAGNGLLQLASGTTKANGLCEGDAFFYRDATASWAVNGYLRSIGPTSGIGYATGAGGTVTQATSRTTGVTLSKVCGQITMFTAAGSATPASFVVTNTAVAATDVVDVCTASGATNVYSFVVSAVSAGSFTVTFWTTGGTASDTPVINFAVTKAVNA